MCTALAGKTCDLVQYRINEEEKADVMPTEEIDCMEASQYTFLRKVNLAARLMGLAVLAVSIRRTAGDVYPQFKAL